MLSGRYAKVFSYGNENLDSESVLFETISSLHKYLARSNNERQDLCLIYYSRKKHSCYWRLFSFIPASHNNASVRQHAQYQKSLTETAQKSLDLLVPIHAAHKLRWGFWACRSHWRSIKIKYP